MNADSVNRWLTLGANIGVLFGIILLLVELDQKRDLVRAQIHQDRSDAWVANRFALADSEFVAPLLAKAFASGFPKNMNALDEWTPVELKRANDVLTAYMGDYDNLFYQYRAGYLDEEFYITRAVPSIRALAPWWKKYGLDGTPSFMEEVERIASGN